jgi:hypothetical protein
MAQVAASTQIGHRWCELRDEVHFSSASCSSEGRHDRPYKFGCRVESAESNNRKDIKLERVDDYLKVVGIAMYKEKHEDVVEGGGTK